MDLQSIEAQAQEFGERVRAAREKKGMSRAELAELAGISRPYLWQLEDGRSRPSLDYTMRIARALGVTVAQLIGEQGQEPRPVAVRVQRDVPDAGRQDGALKFFWRSLRERAIATQKAYHYDRRNFAPAGESRAILDQLDKIFCSGEIQDSCAMLAIEAVKQENAARMKGDRPDEEKLKRAVEAWEDAETLAMREEQPVRREIQEEAVIAVKWSLGNALNLQYRYDLVLERLEYVRALIDDESSGLSTEDIAGLYTTLGWCNYYLASFHQAMARFQEAEQKWKEVSGERSHIDRCKGLTITYRGLGSTYQRMDDFQRAEQMFRKMLEAAEHLASAGKDNAMHLVWGKFRIGSFYIYTGDWPRSEEYLTQADELWAHLDKEGKIDYGLKIVKTMILNNQASLLTRKGGHDRMAMEKLEESLNIGEEIGDIRAAAFSHWFLARLYVMMKEWDKALLHLDLSELRFREMSIQRYVWNVQIYKARVYCAKDLKEAAESLIKRTDISRMESRSHRAQVLATQAFVYAQNQKWEEAEKTFEESILQLEILPYEATKARLDYAEILVEMEKFDQAHQQLTVARQVAGDLGAKRLLKRAGELLQEISTKQTGKE